MSKPTVLFIAPHADDEMLAAAGCLMKLDALGAVIIPALVVGSNLARLEQFAHAAGFYTAVCPHVLKLGGEAVEDGGLDLVSQRDLVTEIDCLLHKYQPDIMFVPWANGHQDHIAVNQACLAAVRPSALHIPRRVLLYAYPGYGPGYGPGCQFEPNVFSDITQGMHRKRQMFDDIYAQQFEGNTSGPYTREGVERVAAWHGLQAGCKFAEGFMHVRGTI